MIYSYQDPKAGDHSAAAVFWSTVEQVPSQFLRQAEPTSLRQTAEPEFVNVQGAQESIITPVFVAGRTGTSNRLVVRVRRFRLYIFFASKREKIPDFSLSFALS
jgi:hypothetical protein